MENTKHSRQWTVEELRAENERRHAILRVPYNPETGLGCCGRREKVVLDGITYFLPESMLREVPATRLSTMSRDEVDRVRYRHDFEFWCVRCITITDKLTGEELALRLNRAQRRVLAVFERQRQEGKPVRVILLKARQCGGSTLVQAYMMWIQLTQRERWTSMVCSHDMGTTGAIASICDDMLKAYPPELMPDGKPTRLARVRPTNRYMRIVGTDSRMVLTCARVNDAARGFDVKMAHLSEVAFWDDTERRSPTDVMRSVNGTVPLVPLSLIVMESTANGMGNFFHSEWLRARSGDSDKEPVFVPWYDMDIYQLEVADVGELWEAMDDYERCLWEELGCTLESINWYHHKSREQSHRQLFMAEFPTTDIEAFCSNTRHVFSSQHLDALRKWCRNDYDTGEVRARRQQGRIVATEFQPSANGVMRVWRHPEAHNTVRDRYVVSVDVGGRSERSDWSVITVFDRMGTEGKTEVVAQWRGHCDHDLLAEKAVEIATYYHRALLVIESNTLESGSTEGDGGRFILKQIGESYPNMYYRQRFERDEASKRPGFQTNATTKQMVVYNLIAWVRDGRYIERDHDAINEMSWFELKPNGTSYGAMRGRHDDLVMTRAIGLWVVSQLNNSHEVRSPVPRDFVGRL